MEVFEASPAVTMWIPSLCYFLYSSSGPVSSILSVKYSFRTVTLIGGTLAASGMMLTTFAQNIIYIYVTVGVLVGAGAGLSFPPTVYIVTSYFVKLRGLANGICISGSAMGSIILPPLLRIILDIYGYRGTCLLIGGVIMNVWVAALFYDPVEKHFKTVTIEPEVAGDNLDEFDSKTLQSINNREDSFVVIDSTLNDTVFSDNSKTFNRSASSATMQTLKSLSNKERKVSVPVAMTNVVQNADKPETLSQRFRTPRTAAPPRRSPSTSSFQYIATPYHGSTLTLQPEVFASSFSLKSSQGKFTKDMTPKKKFIDWTLLKDPLFNVIMISGALNAVCYTNFIIILPQYAKIQNFGKNDGALLLSIVSMFDLIGRIGGSALSDLQCCPKLTYYIVGLFVSGVALTSLPLYGNFIFVSCCCAVFGVFSGAYTGVTAVLMTEKLGEEKLQSSYGICLFVNGILQLISPPICGAVLSGPSSYIMLFVVLGIILVIAGSLSASMIFMPDKKQNGNKI
ncbi:hypothetical protein WA026_008868 [Henosepilachna vigintioctopunctata]